MTFIPPEPRYTVVPLAIRRPEAMYTLLPPFTVIPRPPSLPASQLGMAEILSPLLLHLAGRLAKVMRCPVAVPFAQITSSATTSAAVRITSMSTAMEWVCMLEREGALVNNYKIHSTCCLPTLALLVVCYAASTTEADEEQASFQVKCDGNVAIQPPPGKTEYGRKERDYWHRK